MGPAQSALSRTGFPGLHPYRTNPPHRLIAAVYDRDYMSDPSDLSRDHVSDPSDLPRRVQFCPRTDENIMLVLINGRSTLCAFFSNGSNPLALPLVSWMECIEGYRPRGTDQWLPTNGCPMGTDHRVSSAGGYRAQVTDRRVPTAGYRPQGTDRRVQTVGYRP